MRNTIAKDLEKLLRCAECGDGNLLVVPEGHNLDGTGAPFSVCPSCGFMEDL